MSALVADAAKPPEQWGTQFGSGTPDLSQFVKDISQKIEILRHLCAQSEVLRRKDIADWSSLVAYLGCCGMLRNL